MGWLILGVSLIAGGIGLALWVIYQLATYKPRYRRTGK